MNNKADITTCFSSLSPIVKKYLLSSLAHQLTVCARASYPGQVQEHEAQKQLRVYNELQHSVTGQLTHLLADDNKWYEDADFISILFDKARMENLEKNLIWAFQFAFDHLTPPAARP